MKAVPTPVSASKAASHTRPSPRLPPLVPRHQAAAASPIRAQHARRSSVSRNWIFDGRANKPVNHRAKVGLWLETVEPSQESPPPSPSLPASPAGLRRRSSTLGAASAIPITPRVPPDAALFTRRSGSQRTPLADITSIVLAAESPSSFYETETPADSPHLSSHSSYPASDLTSAIDLLTADEAKRLLFVSAQSDISIADAIRGIAISRTSAGSIELGSPRSIPLADTFRFDGPEYS
ncbi:hypothetical protein B0J18DRAFT_58802 [Chaetomium sp. MPI-SDFR-AT-0129]|nr:hypothetical protein B0J18DRAFT_58802 [Chaetomium sp. MPI-SDFR-AT-0129]